MTISDRDTRVVWHPFRSLELPPPIGIVGAEGASVRTEAGQKLIDTFSSWWVNVHGHNHPYITAALKKQLDALHQVAFVDFTHEPGVRLAERILEKLPGKYSRVFFSDDGATSVEVALKMAIQFWNNRGERRQKIVALDGAYHGDTFGSMSAGVRGVFTAPYDPYLFDVEHLPFPGAQPQACIDAFERIAKSREVGAFIYEPLLQAAAGMRIYSGEVLNELLAVAQKYEVITIADEVMTGFGRTGLMFASQAADLQPDIVCLSKGLTGGTLPLGLTICNEKIVSAFRNPDRAKTFFHSHSFTGSPLACAAALASLDLFEREETWKSIERVCRIQSDFKARVRETGRCDDVRSLGTMFACDLTVPDSGYLSSIRDRIMDYCITRGVYIRPIGNVVYILPPYCITPDELKHVHETLLQCLAVV